ncbi:hypothetical protein J4417_03715 [Candidatus Woesearchaeota archaeon]|nr:hypothetical protein [Candidatus Woesearchaeota archaeon]
MLQRKISKGKFIFAFLATCAIFALGLLLGLVIEGKRINYTNQAYQSHEVNFISSQLQYDYLLSLKDQTSCPTVYNGLDSNLFNLDKTREKIEIYSQDNKINQEEFELLKRQYTLEELRYWFLAGHVKEVCGKGMVRILYFYSDDETCPGCGEQGFVLNYLKKKFGQQLLIFSIDEKMNEPLIELLKGQYNVVKYPTLIIEGAKADSDNFVAKDDLLKRICYYSEDRENCAVSS